MGKVLRGYKYKIYPTEDQARQIDDFIHFTRAVYNWGVAKEEEIFELYNQGLSEYQFYSFFDLHKLFKEEMRTNPKWYFAQSYPTATTKLVLRTVERAYKNFFNHVTEHPKFKSKKTCKKSFSTRHDTFGIRNNCIKIEGVHTCIDLGFDCGINIRRTAKEKAKNVVISKDNCNNYYVSFSLEKEIKTLNVPKSEGIGIDLGIRRTFILSNGKIYTQPNKKINKLKCRLSRQHNHVSRDIKRRMYEADRTKTKYEDIPESKRTRKRREKLNKTYRKIHNIKNTFYHTITKQIVMKNPAYVCMETFSVRETQKNNPYLSSELSNVSFYDITQKMKYKCENYNIPFIQAPKEFASTQICSNCGNKRKMYGLHTYKCPICGMVEDRDINAAKNLKQYGLDLLYSNIEKIA